MIFNISSHVGIESCGAEQRSLAKTKRHFKVHRTVIIAFFFLAVRNFLSRTKEGLGLRMFLRKRQETKELLFTGDFMTCPAHQILLV